MGIVSSMRDLAQNIASSHEDRTKAVLEIREEAQRVTGDAQDLIKGFQTSRSHSGAQLRKDLVKDKASRKSGVKKMLEDAQASRREEGAQLRKELAQGVAERRSEVNAILGDSRSRRKETGSKLREELAQSRSSRKSEVAELLKSSQDLVTYLGKSRQETGKKLRKNLAQGAAARKSEAHVMLNDFQRAHNQMGTQLRKELADYDRGIKSEVAGMRQETKADLGEARTAWQELTRGVKKAAVKATPKVVRAEVAKAAPVEEETPDLETKLLAAITEHPEGITLTEVAESLGVAPVVFGRAARKLVDEGRVRKEDKSYFPVLRVLNRRFLV